MAEICPLCGNKSLVKQNGEMHFDPPKHISTETVIVKDSRWEECEECGKKIFSIELEMKIDQILRERSSIQGKSFVGLTWEEDKLADQEKPPVAKTKKARRVVPNIEVPNCGFDGKIMPLNSIVIAMVGNDPKESIRDSHYPWKKGDSLLYLGEIVNMPGHCSIVTRKGEVHWGYHTDNFRIATEDET